MPIKLFELFDDAAKAGKSAASTPPRNFNQMTVTGSAEALKRKVDISNLVKQRVDYSSFSNFVFFNSALDYFNVSGERMLNEYPYAGTLDDVYTFQSESDGYQNYMLEQWPKTSGCLDLSSSVGVPYVKVTDSLNSIDLTSGIATFEMHLSNAYVSPPATTTVLFELADVSGNAIFSVFNAMGQVGMSSSIGLTGLGFLPSSSTYFAVSIDSSSSRMFYADATSSVVQATVAGGFATVPSQTSELRIGSGTIPGVSTVSMASKVREFRAWNTTKSLADLQANYNTRVYKSSDLTYYARMTEGYGSVVHDYSGNKLSGVAINASWDTSQQLNMSPQDDWDYILDYNTSVIAEYIETNQSAARTFDRNNTGAITRLVPEQYLILEDENNSRVLRDLLYTLARQFDELKVAIQHIPKILVANHTGFNDTPDALLEDALKFWGWDAKGSFLSKEAFQYFLGLNVLSGDQADYDNQRLETTLSEIKNEFWRRTLQNLPYILKTKGTKASVDALLRVYGLNDKSIKLKEFGLKPDVMIQTNRINAEKTAWSRNFVDNNCLSSYSFQDSGSFSTIFNIKFNSGTQTGTIFDYAHSNVADSAEQFSYTCVDGTGSLIYTTSAISVGLTASQINDLPIFNNGWYNISTYHSGSNVNIYVNHLDEDVIDWSTSASFTGHYPVSGPAAALFLYQSNHNLLNFQVWDLELNKTERDDHTLNPFSFGVQTPSRAEKLIGHYTFDRDIDIATGTEFDSSPYGNHLNVLGTYEKDIFEYNFIAPPEYGWNEEKIRLYDGMFPLKEDYWSDSTKLALEFNLIDALNEDISMMMSSLDNWNNVIGDAANRYRETYPQLEQLRKQYFRRLTGRINFRAFADFLDFYDRSFVDLIAKLLPAEAKFTGAEFVVESHMLERPKVQYTYRRSEVQLVPEGTIVIYGHPASTSWIFNPPAVTGSGFQYTFPVTF